MTRFYVYTSAKDELEFVEADSIEQFAEHEFDPTSMVFSGVAVDANDLNDALKLYQHPTSAIGEYIMVDEPQATMTKRRFVEAKSGIEQSFDKVKARLEYLRACLKMQAATMKMHEANTLLNDASQALVEIYGHPEDMPANAVFERLTEAAIKAAIKFNGNTKKSG